MTRENENTEDGFLSRWSRRKRLIAEEEAEALAGTQDAPDDVSAPVASPPEETEEQRTNREAAEAVDLEKLTYESDFSIFMKSGVPQLLRKAAMRKLWTSNPVLANVDGLNDYDEDFADPAMNVFKSAWKAGRGYLKEEPAEKTVSEVSADEKDTENLAEADTEHEEEAVVEDEHDTDAEYSQAIASAEDEQDEPGEDDRVEQVEIDQQPRVSLRDRLKG